MSGLLSCPNAGTRGPRRLLPTIIPSAVLCNDKSSGKVRGREGGNFLKRLFTGARHKRHEQLRGLHPEHHRSFLDRSRRRSFLSESHLSWRKDQVQEHSPALGSPAASWLRGRAELHAQHPASLRMPLTLGFPAGPAKGIMGLLRHSCLLSCCIFDCSSVKETAGSVSPPRRR